jgi:hypothetical protein
MAFLKVFKTEVWLLSLELIPEKRKTVLKQDNDTDLEATMTLSGGQR